MATLKHYRAWFNELNVVEAPDDTERAQREERARIMAESRSTDIYYPSVVDAFAELDTIPGAYEEPAEIAADLVAAKAPAPPIAPASPPCATTSAASSPAGASRSTTK
jgi:hypothetical protein